MENKFVFVGKDVEEASINQVEMESRLDGLTDEVTSTGSCIKRRSVSFRLRSLTHL